jgi:hypothetical protein
VTVSKSLIVLLLVISIHFFPLLHCEPAVSNETFGSIDRY